MKTLALLLLLAATTITASTQPDDTEREKRPGCSRLLP